MRCASFGRGASPASTIPTASLLMQVLLVVLVFSAVDALGAPNVDDAERLGGQDGARGGSTAPGESSTSTPKPTSPEQRFPVMNFNITPGFTFSSGAITDVSLRGFDVAYLQFALPRHTAFDTVVFLNPRDDSCGAFGVYTAFEEATLPTPRPPFTNGASTGEGGGGDTNSSSGGRPVSIFSRLRGYIVASLGQSWLCEQQAEVAYSLKATSAKEEIWNLMLQTRFRGTAEEFNGTRAAAAASHGNSSCVVRVFHIGRPYTALQLEVALLLIVPTILVVWGMIAAGKLACRSDFRLWQWGVGLGRMMLVVPVYAQTLVIRGLLATARWCSGHYDEHKRRLVTEQRDLLSPSSRRSERSAPMSYDEAVDAMHDDDAEMMPMTPHGSQPADEGPAVARGVEGSSSVGLSAQASSAVAAGGDESEEELCRICREDATLEKLIAPCECTGSCRLVHRSCLDKWRVECAQRGHVNATQCEICQRPFKIPIRKTVISRVVAFRMLEAVVLALCLYILFIIASFLGRTTVGELSCLAPYHRTEYSSPFGFWSFVFGSASYAFIVSLIFSGSYYAYLDYRSDPVVVQALEHDLPIPSFWSPARLSTIVLAALWPLVVFALLGYMAKYLVYLHSPHLPWSFELCIFVGATIVALLYMGITLLLCLGILLKRLLVATDHEVDELARASAGAGARATAPATAPEQAASEGHAATDTGASAAEPPQARRSASDTTPVEVVTS